MHTLVVEGLATMNQYEKKKKKKKSIIFYNSSKDQLLNFYENGISTWTIEN